MKEVIKLTGFIFLIIGTLGLLINALIFKWGSIATISFAIVNLVGFITLAIAHWSFKS